MTTGKLSRQLGLASLVIYGIGDILGAGIYALVGRVVAISDRAAWLSFLLSGLLAAITGLSYAELSSRIPRSAGVAAYCAKAFRSPIVPFMAGYLVLISGIVSGATVSLALSGYLQVLINIPQWLSALLFIAAVSFLSFWGIRESTGANAVFTFIELLGLLLVIAVGFFYVFCMNPAELLSRVTPGVAFGPILAGAVLAFYAFVGFEDLANLSEEAKNPSRDIPRAMLVSVAVSSILYVLVVLVVLWTLSTHEASQSLTPLLDVLQKAQFPLPSWGFSLVALFAVCNTGLVNLIMASRLLYGMADQRLLPQVLARVHPARKTPSVAVLVSMVLCMGVVVTGSVGQLAQTTSLLLIIIFFLVHLSLILIKRKEPESDSAFRVPKLVPYLGIFVCFLMLTKVPAEAYLRLMVIAPCGFILYGFVRKSVGVAQTPPL